VYIHPFAEEKNMSHPVITKAARKFAASGFPVLRFDLSCCGDSEGEFQDASIINWQEDLSRAIKIFRQDTGVNHCLLWGLRLGASFALMSEKNNSKEISGLILWQPVLDLSLHISQFLRRNISSKILNNRKTPLQISADLKKNEELEYIIGYPISINIQKSFNDIGSQPSTIFPSVPTFLLSISSMEEPATALKEYWLRVVEERSPAAMKHVITKPFWDRYWQWEYKNITDVTLKWLQGVPQW